MKSVLILIFFVFLSFHIFAQEKEIVKIGFLDAFEDETIAKAKKGFLDALQKGGYSEESKTLQLIYRNAQGDIPTLTQAIDYMVGEKVKLIATNPSISTITAVQKTNSIPIFMMTSPNPERAGLKDKGGNLPKNLFGVYEDLDYIGTSIEIIKALLPNTKRIGLIYNQAEPQSAYIFEEVKRVCKKNNIELVSSPVNNSSETQLVVQSLLAKGIDVFFAMPDNVVFASFEAIHKTCSNANIPVFTSEEGLVLRGAVASYGADMYFWGYQSGEQALSYLKTNDLKHLQPELVKIRRKVYNPNEVRKYNLKVDASFKAIDVPDNNTDADLVEAASDQNNDSYTSFYLSALMLGLGFAALAIGIFISMRIFDIPDITTDGSYTLGGAVAAFLLINHVHIVFVLIISTIAGGLAGISTGFIHSRLKVNSLLSGILVMTALYSVNLMIMGKSNIPLIDTENLLYSLSSLFGNYYSSFWILLSISIFLWLFTSYLLKTDFGLAMRATGNSETMIRANGVNTDRMKIIGLGISNGLVAFSGFLITQYQGFADINMGIGIVIIGLGSVMIGEVFVNALNIQKIEYRILGVVLGAIIFRLILAFVLSIGIDPNLLKLVTALFVLLVVSVPQLRKMR